MLKNRFIAGILAMMMLLCFNGFCVSANTSVSSRVLLDLQGFGIVSGDENGELNLQENVTRAEFCKMVAIMINGSIMHGLFEDRFADVGDAHWASAYINMMAAYGLINGIDKNNFNPDGSITYEQAMKVLVIALGYESRAEAAGGYPDGYKTIGIDLEIGKNVSGKSNQPLIRADVMTMIYNCLDVRLPEPILDQSGGYVIGNETYRTILSGNATEGFRKLTGIVTANYDSYIGNPNSEIEPGQIEFFGALVNIGNTDAYSLLGQEVSIYVRYDDNTNRYTATSAAPTVQNTVIAVNFDEISSINAQKIIYEHNGKNETYNMDGAVFVYNGVPARFDDIKEKLNDGSLTLISNDGDRNIDVVLIESYISGIIESASAEHEYITFKGQGPDGYKRVYASSDYEDDYYTRICNAAGEVITLDDLPEDSALSLFFDNSGTLKMVKSCADEIEGTVEQIEDAARSVLTIDGKEYEIENSIDITGMLGKYVSGKLNFEGKIAQIEIVNTDRKFGVIVAAAAKSGISGDVQVKMLLPNALAEQEEENEDPTADVTKALVARNKEVAVMDVADSLKINDDKYRGSDVLTAVQREIRNTGKGYLVVEYTVNSENKIRSIKEPEEIGTMTTKTYNSKEKTFGKTVEGSAFGINENTLSICVPRNTISSDDDYLAYISMSNGRSYRVSAFEYNDNTYCADLIVINETMTYETAGSITKASKAGLVMQTKVLTENDTRQIVLLTESGETTVTVSDHTGSTADFSDLKRGDLIYYSIDSAGYMDGFSLIASSSPLPETGTYSGDSAAYIGYVSGMRYNEVSNSLNCWVDTLEFVDDAGNTNTFEIRKTSTPPIYIYDTQTRTAEQATTADLLREHERVIVAASGQNVRAVLLIV